MTAGHHHDHGHGHHGHHHHAPASFGQAFAIGIALNSAFVVIEAGYGIGAGSMALVADAGHNLSDVLGLVIAWAASVLTARPATARFTYGLRASTILAALANAAMLLIALGAILVESIRHLLAPVPVAGGAVIVVAAIGIGINGLTALLFVGGRDHDINVRGAYLHMLSDAMVSAGVVVAGLVIWRTGWNWIDPAVSLVITGVIALGTWGLARDALHMGLLAVPATIDHAGVARRLGALPGVAAVHDLHIWPMSTTETALTAHLVMPAGHPGDRFLASLAHDLDHDFAIGHVTIQIETSAEAACDPACGPVLAA